MGSNPYMSIDHTMNARNRYGVFVKYEFYALKMLCSCIVVVSQSYRSRIVGASQSYLQCFAGHCSSIVGLCLCIVGYCHAWPFIAMLPLCIVGCIVDVLYAYKMHCSRYNMPLQCFCYASKCLQLCIAMYCSALQGIAMLRRSDIPPKRHRSQKPSKSPKTLRLIGKRSSGKVDGNTL